MLVLFTDTDTDISPKVAKEYGYNLISMPYCIDGKEIKPYEDFEEFDVKGFYDQLREGKMPTTSAISEKAYINYFEPYFKNGDDILYVHFSRAMTMTFDNMDMAVRKLKEKYPETNFYTIDTKGITIISYTIVREVGDMVKNGKSVEDILSWAETEIDKFAVYFFADDLKFFKRSGRVSGLAATMGTLIGIRPIIYMNDEGKMVSVGKEKGRTKAMKRLITYVDELKDDLDKHRIIVGHTDAEEIAKSIENTLREKFGQNLNIEIVPVNPTAGSHCGPDTVGVCFHAIHR